MDLVRLRMNRCQSAIAPKQNPRKPSPGQRPHSSQLLGACANSRQRSATSLVQRSRVPDYINNHGTGKVEYLTIGRAITPIKADQTSPRAPRDQPTCSQTPNTANKRPTRTVNEGTRSPLAQNQPEQVDRNEPGIIDPQSLEIHLQLKDLDVTQSSIEPQNAFPDEKVLGTYKAVLQDQKYLLNRLKDKLDVEGLEFTGISLGNLVIHVSPKNSEALQNFKELENNGKLTRAINDSIVSDELLEQVGVKSLAINTHIAESGIDKFQEIPSDVKKDKDRTSQGQEISTDEASFSSSVFVSRSQCVDKINNIQTTLNVGVEHIRHNYADFSRNLDKFLMVLKLTKPVYIDEFRRLEHVIMCLQFLVSSESIKKNVRTELVKDFLAIINSFRTKVTEVKNNLSKLKGHILKYTAKDVIDDAFEVCANLAEQFETTFEFSEMGESAFGDDLNAMDRRMFSGLVGYVPWLLDQTKHLIQALDTIRKRLTFDDAEGEDVINIQFRRIKKKDRK